MSRAGATPEARIFRTDNDRRYFLQLLSLTVERFHWLCHSYCLMDNHYHLLIETPAGNLCRGMRHLNGVYTQKWNWKYKKTGHVFQGRYKAIIVDKDAYLLELCRYIALNPVRAHMVPCSRGMEIFGSLPLSCRNSRNTRMAHDRLGARAILR